MMSARKTEQFNTPAAIVLIHGDFGDGYESWGPTCELIGKRYRTVAIDRPGFGEQFGPDTRYTISGEARYLLDAVGDMDITSFHLVGHSYGALIALEMAVSRSDAVRSLHLIEPPLLDLASDQPLVCEMDHRVRLILDHHAGVGDEATTEAFFSMIGADRAIERMRGTPAWDRLCGHATRFARGEPAGAYPRSRLDRLDRTIPVGLYSGGRSHPALRLIVAELADRIDGAHLLDVPDAGHAVQMSGALFAESLLSLVRDADQRWNDRDSGMGAEAAGE